MATAGRQAVQGYRTALPLVMQYTLPSVVSLSILGAAAEQNDYLNPIDQA